MKEYDMNEYVCIWKWLIKLASIVNMDLSVTENKHLFLKP